jgi:hypothetical protein
MNLKLKRKALTHDLKQAVKLSVNGTNGATSEGDLSNLS